MLWRDVPGYEEQYEISDTGLIRNWGTWRILKPRITWEGSNIVNLSNGGVHKTLIVHRLVAQVYIPQPIGNNVVKHKDGNKDNNSADNLYWTHSKRPVKGRVVI
jgi:hypothetical protein